MTLERFWARVEKKDDGCWVWTGARRTDGYGIVAGPVPLRRHVRVHRIAYEALVGEIPAGLTLDHLCRNRLCVNPDHLEPVTAGENVLRGFGPPAANARKTHCKHGHEFTPENTYTRPDGSGRHCKECRRVASRKAFRRTQAVPKAALA